MVVACAALVSLAPAVAMAAPGFVLSGLDAVPTEEGGLTSFTVKLASAPASPVIIDVTSSDPTEVNIFHFGSSSFDASDWNVPRRYFVIGIDDEDDDGDAPIEISVEASAGSDPAYVALGASTIDTHNYDDEAILTFYSPYVRCTGPTAENIHSGFALSLVYDQAAAMNDPPYPWYDPSNPLLDDRVFAENSDGKYLELRTLHVVLKDTYTRNMTVAQTELLRQSYARAVHRIHTTSRGMVELNFKQVVLPTHFGLSSFIDDDAGAPGVVLKFVDYARLKTELAAVGVDYDEYDMISVSLGFTESLLFKRPRDAYAVAPEQPIDQFPYSNSNTWDNDRTMTTVQYTTDPEGPGWIDIFIHEMFHNLEWMLEYGSFTELRNPDDPWWEDTYSYADVMDMFWARPKADYFSIPAPWGTLHTQPATHIVEMWCLNENNYRERRVHCPNGVSCGFLGCRCNA